MFFAAVNASSHEAELLFLHHELPRSGLRDQHIPKERQKCDAGVDRSELQICERGASGHRSSA